MDQHLEPERVHPQMFETATTITPHQSLNTLFIESRPSSISTSTTPSVSIKLEMPPPKYLFPGIVDLGPPAPNTLNFGILLPLNFSLKNEEHWRSIVIGGISVSESFDLWRNSVQRRLGSFITFCFRTLFINSLDRQFASQSTTSTLGRSCQVSDVFAGLASQPSPLYVMLATVLMIGPRVASINLFISSMIVNISLIMRNSQHPVRSPFGGSNAMLSAAYFVTSNVCHSFDCVYTLYSVQLLFTNGLNFLYIFFIFCMVFYFL